MRVARFLYWNILIQLLLSKTANKTPDKYSLYSELSNYLLYMWLHPTRKLDVVPFYANVIKNRLFSSADPSKHYPQNIYSIYMKIKYSTSLMKFVLQKAILIVLLRNQ